MRCTRCDGLLVHTYALDSRNAPHIIRHLSCVNCGNFFDTTTLINRATVVALRPEGTRIARHRLLGGGRVLC